MIQRDGKIHAGSQDGCWIKLVEGVCPCAQTTPKITNRLACNRPRLPLENQTRVSIRSSVRDLRTATLCPDGCARSGFSRCPYMR